MDSKPASMPVEVALSVALEVLQAAIDQGMDACALTVTRKRQLTAEQRLARAKFNDLMTARLVLVEHKAQLKAARVLSAVKKGAEV